MKEEWGGKKKYKGDADETKERKWVKREILFNIGIWIGKGEGWNGENGKWEEGCNEGGGRKEGLGFKIQLMSARNIDVFIPVNL